MKLVVSVKPLAAAANAAAFLSVTILAPVLEKMRWLACAQITAKAGDERISVRANVLDFELTISAPGHVTEGGALAVNAKCFADLIKALPGDAEVIITDDGKAASITCGRARYRLPCIPIIDVPAPLAIADESGRAVVPCGTLRDTIECTSFCISAEETRVILRGTCLHSAGDHLAVVATDCRRLVRCIIAGAGSLVAPEDFKLIVPLVAVRILSKILKPIPADMPIVIRRARNLIEFAGAGFGFTSRLIDGGFPDYRKLIPSPSGNSVTVDRAELAQAIERIAAVSPGRGSNVNVGLAWNAGSPALHVCATVPDLAHNIIEAWTSGSGRTACQVKHAREMLDSIRSKRVCLDHGGGPNPILVAAVDPIEPGVAALQMPCRWPEQPQLVDTSDDGGIPQFLRRRGAA